MKRVIYETLFVCLKHKKFTTPRSSCPDFEHSENVPEDMQICLYCKHFLWLRIGIAFEVVE